MPGVAPGNRAGRKGVRSDAECEQPDKPFVWVDFRCDEQAEGWLPQVADHRAVAAMMLTQSVFEVWL